jgi:hypothetical protein
LGNQCSSKSSKTNQKTREPDGLEKKQADPKKDGRSYAERREYLREYQKGWTKMRRLAWLEANGPCKQCGSWVKLEVDHVDPSQKVSHRVWSWTADRRNAELKKCQVLCQACHKIKSNAFHSRVKTGKRGVAIKLTPDEVEQIYRMAKSGGSPRYIGTLFGIAHSTVIHIRDGRYWRWLTSKLDEQKPEQLPLLGGAA